MLITRIFEGGMRVENEILSDRAKAYYHDSTNTKFTVIAITYYAQGICCPKGGRLEIGPNEPTGD